MSVGIIGAGGIGTALAKRLAAVGIDVIIGNRRGPQTLAALARELGPTVKAATSEDAAKADIVFLAVPWQQVAEALAPLRGWDGRIVVDATNPVIQPGFKHAELGGRTSSEVVSGLVPGARLVKAFNTLTVAVLAANPHEAGGRRVVFISGDERVAKDEIARLADRMGFFPIDLGALATGGVLQQFPGGPLSALNLVKLP